MDTLNFEKKRFLRLFLEALKQDLLFFIKDFNGLDQNILPDF